jgi:hypothetical protein
MNAEDMIEFPLIHDHHSHVSLYASFEGLPDISASDREGALELIRELPRDKLSIVKGWRTDRLDLCTGDLEGMPPALIVNSSLHGFASTQDARPVLENLWPELALSAGDKAWGERHLPQLFAFYEKIAGLDEGKLGSFMSRMESVGIGSLEDMTVSGDGTFDLIANSPFADRIIGWASASAYRGLSPSSRARCAGIKIFLDGSLGARSAALDGPFSDRPAGPLLYSDAELESLIAETASFGARLSAHAIGHEAIRQALRCIEKMRLDGVELESPRIEHAQFIGREEATRCKELGVTLSMQPNFNYDSVDYADRLSSRHREENDPFRMLIDEARFVPGVDLVFGSDGMPHGAAEALTQSLFPAFESQRLSPSELEAGYGAARGAAAESVAYEIFRAEKRVKSADRS